MATGTDHETEATGGIQSLDAALRVLAAMARMDGPVGLSELARECAMPASKTHRYLASFLHAGLARQSGRSGKYDLGPEAIEIGLAALRRHDFVNRIADELPHLVAETGLTGLLCVWGNSGPTIVRWERSRNHIVTALGLGSTLPLLNSATGHVFLAFLPETVTAGLLERELSAGSGARTEQAGAALALADKVRRDGCATVDGRFIPGLVAASAPVLDWQGEAQAAVTLIGTDAGAIAPASPALAALRRFCAAMSIPAGKVR